MSKKKDLSEQSFEDIFNNSLGWIFKGTKAPFTEHKDKDEIQYSVGIGGYSPDSIKAVIQLAINGVPQTDIAYLMEMPSADIDIIVTELTDSLDLGEVA